MNKAETKTINTINNKNEIEKLKKEIEKMKKIPEDDLLCEITFFIDGFKNEQDFISMEIMSDYMSKCGFSENLCISVSVYNFMKFCKFTENNNN